MIPIFTNIFLYRLLCYLLFLHNYNTIQTTYTLRGSLASIPLPPCLGLPEKEILFQELGIFQTFRQNFHTLILVLPHALNCIVLLLSAISLLSHANRFYLLGKMHNSLVLLVSSFHSFMHQFLRNSLKINHSSSVCLAYHVQALYA